jgi:hypothetical protein
MRSEEVDGLDGVLDEAKRGEGIPGRLPYASSQPFTMEGRGMARETITRYVSDVSGKAIDDEKAAVVIRITWPADKRRGAVVVDALVSEVDNLIKVGRKEKPRGRAASAKKN